MSSESWDKKYSTEEYIYTKDANRFVIEYAEKLSGKTAIDLAGGEGRNSIWLAKEGYTVENIDFSSVALAKFLKFAEEENLADKCIATEADATNFSAQLGKVDLGVIAYLHIPLDQLEKAIIRLAEHIAPDGHLLGVWHSAENGEDFSGPKDRPSLAYMNQVLGKTNLEIVALTNREGQIQTKDGLKPSWTLVVLAKASSL
ncbi:MAG: hypothetical protein RIQ88_5 [Actinomycetota bacterium]|jgi:2-polyprenyl-3-methyl-5-hydroxy-6-metoxy-1,4-benzoquinol methylase